MGLYYFANRIQDPVKERDKTICLGKTDAFKARVSERGGIRVEYVPADGPDGALLLANFVTVPVRFDGPTEECSKP
jgi:hypothetical protein